MSDMKGNRQIYSPSFFKLAQLYTAITQHFHIEEVDGILKNSGNINYRFPANSCLTTHHPELVGSTILHLAINFKNLDLKIFELLLNYGADYTLKNKKGLTAIHLAIETIFYKSKNMWERISKLANEYISAILSRQVQSKNPANLCSSYGLSHFHVACMTNHQEAVSFFLENGTPVDQAISMSSLYFPGSTALHIAVRFCAVETIEVLLRFHAKLDIQDARGMTPMHVALQRKIEIADLISLGGKKLSEDMLEYEKIMKQLLVSSKPVDNVGLTNFHIACTMKDLSMAKECLDQIDDIDHFVKFDSPVWPGYTALHFAALFNVGIFQMLVENEANISFEDANGIKPFDICVKSYKLKDIHSILSKHPILKSLLFSDGKTSLLNVIIDMNRRDNRATLGNMNIFIPLNSPLWPGYTPLHIAVIFAHRVTDQFNYEYFYKGRKRVKMFTPVAINDKYLAKGVNLNVQDANGSTPLHLAFRLQKFKVVEGFIEWNKNVITNSVDSDNLSHLHIAAAVGDVELVTQLLKSGATVDMQVHASFRCTKPDNNSYSRKSVRFIIPKGSTALHIAVVGGSYETVNVLLKYGARVYVRDENGMTPIHRQIESQEHMDETEQSMMNLPELKDCIHDSSNLSHLHVASFLGDKEVVKRLLDHGADISAAVKRVDPSNESLRFLVPYEGFTPLHFAWDNDEDGVFQLLIERGADIFVRSTKGVPLFYEKLRTGMIISMLEESEDLRQRMLEDTGLTMLHLVCESLDHEFENFGKWAGLHDINARSHDDSPVWPGCTPLDVFVKSFAKQDTRFEDADPEFSEELLDLDMLFEYGFVENGANVTLVNGSNTTALLEFDRHNRAFKEKIVYDNESDESDDWPMLHYDSYEDKELRKKKIKVKCIWSKSSRQKDEKIPQSKPLRLLFKAHRDFTVNPANDKGISHFHVACLYKYDDVVNQFLKHKVDINSAISLFSDEFPGCTPLHLTMMDHVNPTLSQLLLDHGADLNVRDVFGNTPLHFAAKNSREKLNCSRDIYGDFQSRFYAKDDWKKYMELLSIIINKGADVNARNAFGETPLDILLNSFMSPNTEVIEFFLKYGYHVNSFNPISQESWMPKAFSRSTNRDHHESSNIYESIISAADRIDDFGRTPIHNLSSHSHTPEHGIRLLGALAKHGCNVDQQDIIGRSALHIAVQFANAEAITELLKLGADINVEDSSGKVPFGYCFEASTLEALRRSFNNGYSKKEKYEKIKQIFSIHIRKLQLIRLDVNKNNLLTLKNLDQTTVVNLNSFNEQLEGLKSMKIQCDRFSIDLYDFLSETKIVAAYPNMLQTKRQAINNFFESSDFYNLRDNLDELFGFLKLQYKKVVQRGRLIKDVDDCLNILAEMSLPYLISEMIIKLLSNLDLKNLKASVREELLRERRRFLV